MKRVETVRRNGQVPTIACMYGPVDWGAHSGEHLERVMAVFAAQINPETIRRTPASGDGGIDLMLPDHNGYEIWQVKSFTRRLNKSQRRQIKDSYENLLSNPRLERPISAYRLVIPLNPTPNEQTWFENLTADAPWPVAWYGEPHWDRLAANYPQVIDYYFGGGQQRVIARAKDLRRGEVDLGFPVLAVDLLPRVEALMRILDRDDPHFRYEITAGAATSTSPTGCVLSRGITTPGGLGIAIHVFPKHRYALEDEPIFGQLDLSFGPSQPDLEARASFEAFLDFGSAVELPAHTVRGKLHAPGGLGGTLDDGTIRFDSLPRQQDELPLRVVVVDQSGEIVEEIDVQTLRASKGVRGGAELTLSDPSGFLGIDLRVSTPGPTGDHSLAFSVKVEDAVGRPVLEVLPCLRLIRSLVAPNELQIRLRHGTTVLAGTSVRSRTPAADPEVLEYLEDLAFLQNYAPGPIYVDDETDAETVALVHEYAKMLRGETVRGEWNEVRLSLAVSRQMILEKLTEAGCLAVEQPVVIEIGDQQIAVGPISTILASCRVARDQPNDPGVLLLEPGDDRTVTRRAGPLSPRSARSS